MERLLLASWSTLLPILLVQCRLLDISLLPLESPPAGLPVSLPAPPVSAVPGQLPLERLLLPPGHLDSLPPGRLPSWQSPSAIY